MYSVFCTLISSKMYKGLQMVVVVWLWQLCIKRAVDHPCPAPALPPGGETCPPARSSSSQVKTWRWNCFFFWELSNDGMYKNENDSRTIAQPRLLIGKIELHNNVGYIGKTLRVVVVHLHRNVAKKEYGFARQREEYWEHLAQVLREHEVHVLTGDLNMA